MLHMPSHSSSAMESPPTVQLGLLSRENRGGTGEGGHQRFHYKVVP